MGLTKQFNIASQGRNEMPTFTVWGKEKEEVIKKKFKAKDMVDALSKITEQLAGAQLIRLEKGSH